MHKLRLCIESNTRQSPNITRVSSWIILRLSWSIWWTSNSERFQSVLTSHRFHEQSTSRCELRDGRHESERAVLELFLFIYYWSGRNNLVYLVKNGCC